jgi:RHS repeat-associated protein
MSFAAHFKRTLKLDPHRPRHLPYRTMQEERTDPFDCFANHWYWQDGRGNTSHITGDPGNLLERYTYDLSGAPKFYDEWGSERWGGSVYDTRFLFAGSQYLPDTGLYDMRNRFYYIALNRFLQADPIGFNADPSIFTATAAMILWIKLIQRD